MGSTAALLEGATGGARGTTEIGLRAADLWVDKQLAEKLSWTKWGQDAIDNRERRSKAMADVAAKGAHVTGEVAGIAAERYSNWNVLGNLAEDFVAGVSITGNAIGNKASSFWQGYRTADPRTVQLVAMTAPEFALAAISGGQSAWRKIGKEAAEETGEIVAREVAEEAADLFGSSRNRNLANLTNKEVGDIGEDIATRFLRENDYTDIYAVQNRSGNGIDIVARSRDGRLSFFEVKTSRTGKVKNLSERQEGMTDFVEDVLGQASNGSGRYQNIPAEMQSRADAMLREFRMSPGDVSGNVIGVDLPGETLRVSPWNR